MGPAKIARDIGERKRLERQKDTFIGVATHELKTPITSIKAYAQTLQRVFLKEGQESAARSLAKMDVQLDRLTNLIGDLLDASKIQEGRLQFRETLFDADAFVAEVVDQLQPVSDRHHLIIQGRAERSVAADRDRLGQVLTNLLTNAIKYSPQAEEVLIHVSATDQEFTVKVQDYGIGIPTDDQSRVFERFYRVSGPSEATFPGLGLGLYISAEIIQRLGGKIWVESTFGAGAIFAFRIPLSKR